MNHSSNITNSNGNHRELFTSPFATLELVGREELLQEIDQLLRGAGSAPQVIYLKGVGGIGKTRLLNALLGTYQDHPSLLAATELVDLYHHKYHTPLGLSDAIVAAFPEQHTAFSNYRNRRRQYSEASLADDPRSRNEAYEALMQAFQEDLIGLGRRQRLIVALDTLERLVYSKNEETVGNERAEYALIWPWLVNQLPTWDNVTLIVAGRPASDALIHDLRESIAALHPIQVDPFTLEESARYFKAAADAARHNSMPDIADRIARLTDRHVRAASRLSEGRPVYLGLLIDQLTLGHVPSVFEEPEQLENPAVLEAARANFESDFVTRVMEGGQQGRLVAMLGRLPKGADATMLSEIMGIAQEALEPELALLRALSFVKHRQDGRIFLHDEMYDLLRRNLYDQPGDDFIGRKVLEKVLAYYERRFDGNQGCLDTLFRPVEVEEIGGRAAENLHFDGITEAQVERRDLLTEFMYYRLRENRDRGLKQYYRYMREAILSGDPILDAQLQAELVQLLEGLEASTEPLDEHSKQAIKGVLKLRPITRAHSSGRYQDAVDLARGQWKALLGPGGADKILDASLKIWGSQALIYLGGGYFEEADDLLTKAIGVLEAVAPEAAPEINFVPWRINALVGLAYRVRGYLYRLQGRLNEAVDDYRQAIEMWRALSFKVELATTLNDAGFAIAQQGKERAGRRAVSEALELRRELTHRIPVALSLNTLGIISRRTGAYVAAIERSERARRLARALGSIRVEGLALTALAEARRRWALSSQIPSSMEKGNLLGAAIEDAKAATALFDATGEQVRQVESRIEVGCALRDMIRAGCLGNRDKEQVASESRAAFEEAATIAENLPVMRSDALTNLAWLEFVAESPDEVMDRAITRAEETVPEGYRITQSGHTSTLSSRSVRHVPYYVQLAKQGSLKGHRALRDAQHSSEYRAGGVPEKLREAVTHFIESFEYNQRVHEHGRDYSRLQDEIYERLSKLNARQLRAVSIHVRDNMNRPGATQMREFLRDSTLWYD